MFETLENTGTKYADVLGALNTYFVPQKNIAFERHTAKQQDDEKEDNFIELLSKLSLGCDFKDEAEKNDMIRYQVVNCCK